MNFLGKDIHEAAQIRHSKEMQIKHVMSKQVVTVKQVTSLHEAATLMTQHHISGLPVVDVEDRVIAIITEADFISAMDVSGGSAVQHTSATIIRKGRARKQMGSIVGDLMTTNPVAIAQQHTLQRAIELMDKNQVKGPIVTGLENRAKDIVCRVDLMKLFTVKG